MLKKKNTEEVIEPQLTTAQIAQAAINSPSLSSDEFKLSDQTFKVIDLPYDAYVNFLTLLSPMIESMFGGIAASAGIPGASVNSEAFSVTSVIKHCAIYLPDLVTIVCQQTDPNITREDVKKLGRSPLVLAGVVLKQLERNNMIKEFADFFAQALPVLKANLPKRN